MNNSGYELQFWIDNYGRREEVMEGALSMVWRELRNNGISPLTFDDKIREQTVAHHTAIEATAEAGE